MRVSFESQNESSTEKQERVGSKSRMEVFSDFRKSELDQGVRFGSSWHCATFVSRFEKRGG